MLDQKSYFEDEEYFRKTLLVVSMLCFIGTGFLGLQLLSSNSNVLTIGGLFAGTLVSGTMFILAWRNILKLPRYLLPPVAFSIVVFLVLAGDGIRDEGILGFILVITLAGLLIGRNWVLVNTVSSVIAITIIGYGQLNGWFPRIAEHALGFHRIIIIDIIFILIGSVVFVNISNLEHVLKKIKQREIELENSNQALRDIQVDLETRIAERVSSLKTAQEEAEQARQETEKQVWQATGLARLGDVMRGGKKESELAANIIQHLCNYVDGQVGAIFLRDEQDQLQQIGCYAGSETQSPSFAIGEGIIGQAAESPETIIISDIPAESIRIRSGLSEFPPSHLIAIPFFFNQEVTGVIEIGTLKPLAPHQLSFLESTTENIAVAFHTAHTRAQVDQLLKQTQQQAEKLQERQKELRAVNEELETQAENLRIANLELKAQAERLNAYEQQGMRKRDKK